MFLPLKHKELSHELELQFYKKPKSSKQHNQPNVFTLTYSHTKAAYLHH